MAKMNDTQRLDWLIKVKAMIWNDHGGKQGFTICVPSTMSPGKYEVESGDKNLRKAIDKAYLIWQR
jgi:hypothetical protein